MHRWRPRTAWSTAALALALAGGCGSKVSNTAATTGSGGAPGVGGAGGMGGSAPACPSSAKVCAGICTDVANDPSNCGACGKACALAEVCWHGQCSLACLGGTQSCNGKCVDPSVDPQNCGSCGMACPAGLVCSLGQCSLSCLGGTQSCNGKCADTSVDPSNCGGCGKNCAMGQACAQAACACPAGAKLCGGACVDVALDPSNCGDCGKACAPGGFCQGGQCNCGQSQALAGSSCSDIHARCPNVADGVAWVKPGANAFQTYCDMTTDGGGWTLVYGYAYQKANNAQLDTQGSQLITQTVSPDGPSPDNNYRLALNQWNSVSPNREWLYRARNKTGGPAATPGDFWISATEMRLDPNQSYRAVHDAQTTTTASNPCLQKLVLVVHSQGPLSGGCPTAGNWDQPNNCAGGPPWPTICCWCLTVGTPGGNVTPTDCGTATVSGNVFFNRNDPNQQCGPDETAMGGSTYGSVSLSVR